MPRDPRSEGLASFLNTYSQLQGNNQQQNQGQNQGQNQQQNQGQNQNPAPLPIQIINIKQAINLITPLDNQGLQI
jgi:hypothetical protein